MKISIRQAAAEDIDTLLKWRMEVIHHVFDIPEDEDIQSLCEANRQYYEKEIPAGGHVAVFAKCYDVIIGCGGLCLYSEMPSPDNPSGKCAYLMNIYRRDDYRDCGVGKAIVSWLIDYARNQGITKIYLETTGSGRSLYESLGFTDMKDYLKL